MALRADQRLDVSEEVLSRVLEDEAVLLDLKSGTYFGLNVPGTFIWERIRQGATVGEIRQALLEVFDVDETTVDAELERLVDDLAARGLVTLSG